MSQGDGSQVLDEHRLDIQSLTVVVCVDIEQARFNGHRSSCVGSRYYLCPPCLPRLQQLELLADLANTDNTESGICITR